MCAFCISFINDFSHHYPLGLNGLLTIREEMKYSTIQVGCFSLIYFNSRSVLINWEKPSNESHSLRLTWSLITIHHIGWLLYFSMFNCAGLKCYIICQKSFSLIYNITIQVWNIETTKVSQKFCNILVIIFC